MFSNLTNPAIVKQGNAKIEYPVNEIMWDIIFLEDYYMLNEKTKYNIYRINDNKLHAVFYTRSMISRGFHNTFYYSATSACYSIFHIQPDGTVKKEKATSYSPLWIDNVTRTCMKFNGDDGFKLINDGITTQLLSRKILWDGLRVSILNGLDTKTNEVFAYDRDTERVEFITKVPLPKDCTTPLEFDKSRNILLLYDTLWDIRYMHRPLAAFDGEINLFRGYVLFKGSSLPITQLDSIPQVVLQEEGSEFFREDHIEVFWRDSTHSLNRSTYIA